MPRDECDTDRSRGERARRDWLHISGMPRIRGVALDSAPSRLLGDTSSSSALCLLATIMIDHIRIPDPEDIDGSGEDIFVIDRHRSDLSETVMRSLLDGDFKDG